MLLIKDVALYLRKSRGDEEEDLDKHRLMLTTLCKKNNWSYVEYFEIGTSDSIDLRPEMVRLLADVEDGLYDAVVVVDIDRLSRGDEEDRGRYLNIFRDAETYIVTPDKIYDLDDDNDDLHISVKGLLAREEYKSISKRFKRGKVLGARQGNWTNGTPPYPYEYQKWHDKYNKKGLVVNDNKYPTYRYILESFLEPDGSMTGIARGLNKKGVPSPRNGRWHAKTIERLLINEVHLGKIVSNKTKSKKHKNKKTERTDIPKSEWVIVENRHEPCKTQDEHNEILVKISKSKQNASVNRQKRDTIYRLSGLVKCAYCGSTMTPYLRKDRNDSDVIKTCWYIHDDGSYCGNNSGLSMLAYKAIESQLVIYEQSLIGKLNESEKIDTTAIEGKIVWKLKEIQSKKKAIENIFIAFENGVYDLNTFKERKEITEKQLNVISSELEVLELELGVAKDTTIKEKLEYIDRYKTLIQKENMTDKDVNLLYKSIIDNISWEKDGGYNRVVVNFL